MLRRGRSGCRPRRRAPRAGRALSDFGDASTVSVLRDVVKDGQGRTRSLERPRRQCGGAASNRHLSRHALPMGSPWRESAAATPTRRAVDGSPGQGSAGRFFAGCQLSRRLLATYLDRAQPGCPHCTIDDESALNAVHFARAGPTVLASRTTTGCRIPGSSSSGTTRKVDVLARHRAAHHV